MERMKMETPDLVKRNIERIAELFPSAISEKKGLDGKLCRAINFDVLKQLLTDEALAGDEAYEFTWVGKKAAMVEASRPIRKTLRPCKEESKNWDTTGNLYIEGDNLAVLKLLQESYLGKVKMIYIDPPYNTGHDFIYRDRFARSRHEENEQMGMSDEETGDKLFQNTESNGRFHSDWCSMIYPRLMLARNLLAEDGVIFISIDYNENYNCRAILNEVFGTTNFVGEIYWESKTKSQNTSTAFNKLQPKAEMILVYTKQSKRRFNLLSKGQKNYPLSDEKGEYREYHLEVMNASGIRGRETMVYEITDGVSTVAPPAGKQWKFGQTQVSTFNAEGNLFIRNGKVIIKMRPEFERGENTEPFWGFFSKEIGTAESAKKELTEILGEHGFETVKPVDMIERLSLHAIEGNDIILDFFSGSATTAHAVMQLNAKDGGRRKFIMVQYPEVCSEDSEAYKAGYRTICDIGKERIRRAGERIKTTTPPPTENLDVGFRVLKLDETNMKEIYYSAGEYTQDLLSALESNIKEDRTDLDLLFGCLLEWGLPLSFPYTSEKMEGCTVHTYNGNDLIACFDENIPEDVVKEIARRKPLRVVFRDSSFVSSPARINVEEIFKRLSPTTSVKVL